MTRMSSRRWRRFAIRSVRGMSDIVAADIQQTQLRSAFIGNPDVTVR